MLKSLNFCRSVKHINALNRKRLTPIITRHLSEDKSDNDINKEMIDNKNESEAKNVGNEDILEKLTFAKAFNKFEKIVTDTQKPTKPKSLPTEPFPTLLRHSPLMQLGDPEGKVVVGRIVQVIEDDLYIDFGAKFNAVCRRPKRNQSDYVRGTKVKVRINDMELSERFLGSTKDMTLLEADVTLIGIIWSAIRNKDKVTQTPDNQLQEMEI